MSPRYLRDPLSGEGARRTGGRWNRPGRRALYLADTLHGAVAEYHRHLNLRPGAFLAYDLRAILIDLTDPKTRARHDVNAQVLVAGWRLIIAAGGDPESWVLADRLAQDWHGVRVPSALHSGSNVVLWRWAEPDGAEVTIIDPQDDLPSP